MLLWSSHHQVLSFYYVVITSTATGYTIPLHHFCNMTAYQTTTTTIASNSNYPIPKYRFAIADPPSFYQHISRSIFRVLMTMGRKYALLPRRQTLSPTELRGTPLLSSSCKDDSLHLQASMWSTEDLAKQPSKLPSQEEENTSHTIMSPYTLWLIPQEKKAGWEFTSTSSSLSRVNSIIRTVLQAGRQALSGRGWGCRVTLISSLYRHIQI